jgi:2',3'-cyclic-nucleotide 2'-phosphodiesterase (5'-nucleotidase family)
VARRATVIKQEREKGAFVLLLDAGDSLASDQDPARQTQGRTSVGALNRMGYDAMVLGPQDLALGPEALRQRIGEAKFAVLSANAVVSGTNDLVATPFVLREFHGLTLAVVGLSGGGTPEIAVRDPLQAARTVVAEVAPQANVVILLSHAGALVDQQIAAAVPGIDVIVSGGAFELATPWRSPKTGTLILHADQASPGHAGRRLGIAQLAFDAQGQLVEENWQQLALGPDIADDAEMALWVRQQTVQ